MKNLSKIFLIATLSLLLTGCGDKVETKTCNTDINGMLQTVKLEAVNDDINKATVTIKYDNKSMFGVETLSSLTEEQKNEVRNNILTTYGLDSEIDGIDVEVNIDEEMVITIKADFDKAEPETLRKIGIDLESSDMSLEKSTEDLTENGYTCK